MTKKRPEPTFQKHIAQYLISKHKYGVFEQELADILIYLVRIADKLGIDLVQAANEKMDLNAVKYPASVVHGSSKKYDEY